MTDPIASLREQLLQLSARHQAGTLNKKDYERERAALERALLDRVMATPAPAASVAEPVARPSRGLVALLTAFVLAVAGVGYGITGSPSLIAGLPPAPAAADAASHSVEGEQFAAAVERLAEKLATQPDNAEGWAMLARSYVRLGRFGEALPAFAKAVALQGQDAKLLADYADAMAVQNDRKLEGEPTSLVERALKIEPANPKALALAGTAAFNRKDFAGAVGYWEKLAQTAPPDSAFLDQVQKGIAEARELGGLGPAPALGAAPKAQAAPTAAAPPQASITAAAGGAGVSGEVRLAPALAQRVSPEDTVFIFARAAEGPRMPLAILRHQVKDLPIRFALDDSTAMAPAMRLSLHPKVVIGARISKSGQAVPAPGDLSGQSASVANNAQGVMVNISEVVGN